MRCAEARVDLSARLDDELDVVEGEALEAHLETCAACRREEEVLRATRRAVRIQPVEDVPDLTNRIMQAVAADGPRLRRRSEWNVRFKVAAVAASVSALVLAGATLPVGSDRGDVASAGEISSAVSSAARSLGGYRASYDIVERGFHSKVPVRRFSAEVWFEAPERFRMLVSDFTAYPNASWTKNNVQLVANARKWFIEEPTDWDCPLAAARPCALSAHTPTESRTIVGRQPFDGTSHLPTDLVVPLETLVSSDGFEVLERDPVGVREAHHLTLRYGSAVPLVDALQAGGSWRPFNPMDRVDLWIDAETWFPLRYEVRAASTQDRAVWAHQQGLQDAPGEKLLSVEATNFEMPKSFGPQTFRVPTRGLVKSGGFEASAEDMPPWAREPAYVAGLDPYRFGRTDGGQVVHSYAHGMTWLKITTGRLQARNALHPTTAELVELPGGGGWAYYQPASATLGRRLDIFGRRLHLHVESNLPSSELIRVAASLGVNADKPERRSGPGLIRIDDPDPYGRVSYARAPSYVPTGYDLASALVARGRDGRSTLTTYYRGSEADYSEVGIRITQSRPVRLLVPSSRDLTRVTLGEFEARWAPDLGQLEWIDAGTYRSITVPSFDLATAMAIARGLE
jgi:Putative zinc-finger